MRIAGGFCLRNILGETIAVPTGEAATYLSGLVSLNETGAFLFEKLQAEQTAESLIHALLEEYDTDPETARRDVTRFLEIMSRHNLLITDNGEVDA